MEAPYPINGRGETHLLIAIIRRAILDVQGLCERSEKKQAREWLLSDSLEPFSLRWILQHLLVEDDLEQQLLLQLQQYAKKPRTATNKWRYIKRAIYKQYEYKNK